MKECGKLTDNYWKGRVNKYNSMVYVFEETHGFTAISESYAKKWQKESGELNFWNYKIVPDDDPILKNDFYDEKIETRARKEGFIP